MTSDAALLQSYTIHGDEAAFQTLVERHLPMVYSAALRQVGGDKHLAEDVAQSVFRDLAQDAADFSSESCVAAWLYRVTHFTAAKVVRTETRRRAREAAVASEYDAHTTGEFTNDPALNWEAIHDLVDRAINELGEKDRIAILLRFFQGMDYRAVGVALDVSDDTAQKRVSRALERLRSLLVQRGVCLSATALGALLADNAVAAAPTGLATAIFAGKIASVGGVIVKASAISIRHKIVYGAVAAMVFALAVLLLNQPPPAIVTYDLANGFPVDTNSTSVWSFGWTPTLGGAFSPLRHPTRYSSHNGQPLFSWSVGQALQPVVVQHVGTGLAISGGDEFVGAPGTIWYSPGPDGSMRDFGVIRFTVPPKGRAKYHISAAVTSLLDGPESGDGEFHILKNGKELFVQHIEPNAGAAFSDVLKLSSGDQIDFVAGQGRNRKDRNGLKIRVVLTTDLSAPKQDLRYALMQAPVVLTAPKSGGELLGGQAEMEVVAGGTRPLRYQWSLNDSSIIGATNHLLRLTNLTEAHEGEYRVSVSNGAGMATSSPARLTATTCVPIPPGLVCWWSGEGSASDRFGGQHGTRHAGTTFGPGRVGRAFLFQGEQAGIAFPASSTLDIGANGAFTVEGWIKPATISGKLPIIGWNSETASGVNLAIVDGVLYASLRNNKRERHSLTSEPGTIVAGQWQHIALVCNSSAESFRLYCDGKVVADERIELFMPNTALDLQMGHRRERTLLLTYAGLMDEICLYRRALGSEEITALFSAGGAGKCVSRATTSGRAVSNAVYAKPETFVPVD